MEKISEKKSEQNVCSCERKSISDICKIVTGKLNANAMTENGQYRFFTCADEIYKIDNYAFDGQALLVAGNGYLGSVKYYNGKFNAYQRTYVLMDFSECVEIRYAYYHMSCFFRAHALKQQKEGSVPYITIAAFNNYEIPLPSLSFQQEIVRTLDIFNSIISNLERELSSRQKQYNNYREQLFTRAEGEVKSLGSLGVFENIGTDKKTIPGERIVTLLNYVDVYHNKFIDKSIPSMRVSASEKKCLNCTVEKGDIFVTPSSETIDDIGHSAVITETIEGAIYSYHIMRYRLHDVNMTTACYINYIFDTYAVKSQILKKAQGLTRYGLTKEKFASIEIPFPSIQKQKEIVSILDTYEAIISNLKQEIAARQKQYEYYREKLLTFQ